MRDLTEMNKLEAYLKEKGFKYERTDSENTMDPMATEWMAANYGPNFEPFDLHQIVVYDGAVRIWDVLSSRIVWSGSGIARRNGRPVRAGCRGMADS